MFLYSIDNAIPPDYPYYNTLFIYLDLVYSRRPKRFAVLSVVVEVVLTLEIEVLRWLRGSDF